MIRVTGNTLKLMLLLAVVGLLFGCQSPQKPHGAHAVAEKGQQVAVTPDDGNGDTGMNVRSQTAGKEIPINELDVPGASDLCPRIHFDYDKSEIKDEWEDCLNKIAAFCQEYFQQNTKSVLIIEGHCDERGSNEYNLALGERRSNSTKEYLLNKGMNGEKIYTRSWGEERPIATCHDESCWWQNRRAEFYVVNMAE